MFFDQARETAEREHKANPQDPLVRHWPGVGSRVGRCMRHLLGEKFLGTFAQVIITASYNLYAIVTRC